MVFVMSIQQLDISSPWWSTAPEDATKASEIPRSFVLHLKWFERKLPLSGNCFSGC